MRKKHKLSTAASLLHRASNLPRTKKVKRKKSTTLKANGYPTSVISNILRSNNNDDNNNNNNNNSNNNNNNNNNNNKMMLNLFPLLKNLLECFLNGPANLQ